MKNHRYKTQLKWTGNEGKGTLNYKSYSRSHTINVKGKYSDIMASSDQAFLGDPTKYNPEELLISSISACHMLWYLHLCATNNVIVIDYTDNATGTMEELPNGSGKFTEVVLHPCVTVSNQEMINKAIELHAEAHKMCYIANSCNFEISHRPETKVQ